MILTQTTYDKMTQIIPDNMTQTTNDNTTQITDGNNDNNGNLSSAYPAAQSTEQYDSYLVTGV